MDSFNLMSSDHFLVVLHPDRKHGLIFNRLDNTTALIDHDDAKELTNLKDICRIHGIIGRFLDKYLVVIVGRTFVGTLYEPSSKTHHEVYVITQAKAIEVSSQISSVSINSHGSVRYDATASTSYSNTDDCLASNSDINVSNDFTSMPITINTGSQHIQPRQNQWIPFRIANTLKPKISSQILRSGLDATKIPSSLNSNRPGSKVLGNNDDSDRRLVEEMVKLFNNTNSFYFSPTLDLTNRLSRCISSTKDDISQPIWKTADERFFWNRHMLKDLIELSEKDNDINLFICVILQGFIAIQDQTLYHDSISNESGIESGLPAATANQNPEISCNNVCDRESPTFEDRFISRSHQLALISRRSVFHAGTRYRRRGCDYKGNCANFVETEQIFRSDQHVTSFVILRGSIPLYWYQTGYNYRPPPVLFNSEEENHKAFSEHFDGLMNTYDTDNVCIVDCTEQSGREKSLHDTYKRQAQLYKKRCSGMKLIEFDFHKHCRGRQCTDSQVERHLKSCGLTDQVMKDIKYYWNDGSVIWQQDGVVRVNCLDCSDRTNVVQRAIALQVLDIQLARLGVIAPDTSPDDNQLRRTMQTIWSTNGNVLSTQYCGTRALFTGDKKLSGYLKDTYSSASRYYISKFRDAYRQAAIDAMLGVDPNEINSGVGSITCSKTPGDYYDLLNLEPIRSGTLLKDVGARVTNRLARLKGRFHHVKPYGVGLDNIEMSHEDVVAIDDADSAIIESRLNDRLKHLNIDWPSTESVDKIVDRQAAADIFEKIANEDDRFQDDDLGDMVLSMDFAELQRMRPREEEKSQDSSSGKNMPIESAQAIDMTEAGSALSVITNDKSSSDDQAKTSTTTT